MALARAVVVFGLFGLAMYLDPKHIFKEAWKDQLILFGAGLVRGAITWAQVSFTGEGMEVCFLSVLVAMRRCFQEATLLVLKTINSSPTQTSSLIHPTRRPCNYQEATGASSSPPPSKSFPSPC